MRVAALVVPMACVLSDDEDSDNGAPPHRSGVLTAIASPCKLSMPSTLTSVASLVKDGEPNEWIVRAGDDVSKFLYANGPGRIVRYNFRQVRGTRVERRLVERSSTSAGLDFSDIFALTGEGQRASSSLLAPRLQVPARMHGQVDAQQGSAKLPAALQLRGVLLTILRLLGLRARLLSIAPVQKRRFTISAWQ